MDDATRTLNGQVALVTGGGRGIGRAMAERLAASGMTVVVTSRSDLELEETVSEIARRGGQSLALVGDATDPDDVARVVETTLERLSRVDLLINNAGLLHAVGPVWEVDVTRWWREIEVNLRSVQLFSHHVLKHMVARGRGRIVNLAGGGTAYLTAYGVSKGAVSTLTRLINQEVLEYGVRVFEIHPGPVDTRLAREFAALPEARRWLGSMLEAVEQQRVSVDGAARVALEIARGEHDQRAGRLLRATEEVL